MNEPFTDIFGDNHEPQYIVAREIKRTRQMRKTKIGDVGLPHTMTPMIQDTVELQ